MKFFIAIFICFLFVVFSNNLNKLILLQIFNVQEEKVFFI